MKKKNQRKHTRIPLLAQYIAAFNAGRLPKWILNKQIARTADQFYAMSVRGRGLKP